MHPVEPKVSLTYAEGLMLTGKDRGRMTILPPARRLTCSGELGPQLSMQVGTSWENGDQPSALGVWLRMRVLCTYVCSLFTVHLSMNVRPGTSLLFILGGWGEGCRTEWSGPGAGVNPDSLRLHLVALMAFG